MDKIEIVKRQQGKGPGDFCNIVSAMVPHPTVQGLFLVSLKFPYSVAQSLLINFNNTE